VNTTPARVELDMGFTVEEVASGVERVLTQSGYDGVKREPAGEGWRLSCTNDEIRVVIAPMPAEPISHPWMFPRTSLILECEPGALEPLRRKILHAFLRVGG
jgi:hypothetical protein